MNAKEQLFQLLKRLENYAFRLQRFLKIPQLIRLSKKRPVTNLIFAIFLYSAARSWSPSWSPKDLDSLNSALRFSEHEILLFSAIVVIGCVGEALETDWWKQRHTIFAIWVALGVTGETFSDAEVYDVSGLLQTAAETAVGDARVQAAAANERAANLEKKNLELAKEIAPRDLPKGADDVITAALNGQKWKIIRLVTYSMDAEGTRFTAQLNRAFEHTLFVKKFGNMVINAEVPDQGVEVAGADSDLVAHLKSALTAVGYAPHDPIGEIPTGFTQEPMTAVGAVVFVGVKPIPE